MAITSIDLGGTPWMVCDPDHPDEIDDVVDKSGVDASIVTTRPASPQEAAKLAAERVLTQRRGGDPDKVFGVAL